MQDFTNFSPQQQGSLAVNAASEAAFFQRVYTWMFAGLLLTAASAYVLSHSIAWLSFLYGNGKLVHFGVSLIPLFFSLYLQTRIDHLSTGAAKLIFLLYAASFGALISGLIIFYPASAFIKAFISASSIYGGMAIYGLVTKRSLEGWGSFLIMGVWGLVAASVLNLFIFESTFMDMVICGVGVIVFAALTAYDHQKLRVVYATGLDGTAAGETRATILGALHLYIDFMALFLYLLRIFGRGND